MYLLCSTHVLRVTCTLAMMPQLFNEQGLLGEEGGLARGGTTSESVTTRSLCVHTTHTLLCPEDAV